MNEFKRQSGESPDEYRIRLYRNKYIYGLSNAEIGKLCNEAFGVNYDESTHRKKVTAYIKGFDEARTKLINDNQAVKDMYDKAVKEKLEAEKQKITLRDERASLNRIKREIARSDYLLSNIERYMATYSPIEFKSQQSNIIESDNDMVVHLTDIHTGIKIDNVFNKFNNEILIQRLNKYIGQIEFIQRTHRSEKCYLVLGGDLISGLIHFGIRCENNENVIEQIMTASNIIAEFVNKLSSLFSMVYVYAVSGNHSRVVADKNLNLKGENLDSLIPFYLEKIFSNFDNVQICNNDEESYCRFVVRGNKCFGCHGDKDTVEKVRNNIINMFNVIPDIIFMGHRHRNGLSTFVNTKVVESGSVSGIDNYCIDKRINGNPEQTVSIITSEGLLCLYNIDLKEKQENEKRNSLYG